MVAYRRWNLHVRCLSHTSKSLLPSACNDGKFIPLQSLGTASLEDFPEANINCNKHAFQMDFLHIQVKKHSSYINWKCAMEIVGPLRKSSTIEFLLLTFAPRWKPFTPHQKHKEIFPGNCSLALIVKWCELRRLLVRVTQSIFVQRVQYAISWLFVVLFVILLSIENKLAGFTLVVMN